MDELKKHFKWRNTSPPESLKTKEYHPEIVKNWHRIRLEPLLKKFLYPVCWSLFLLIVGIMFSILDHNTNFSEFIGLFLILSGVFSLGFSIIKISNNHEDSKPILVIKELISRTRFFMTIIIILLTSISILYKPENQLFWNLIIIPSMILWIEWLAFGSFYFSSPSAIWILNRKMDDNLPKEGLENSGWKWVSDSLNPRNSPFAIKKMNDGFLELCTIKKDNVNYITLSWWQKGGIRHDPFVKNIIRGVAIPKLTKKLGYLSTEIDIKSLDGIQLIN